MTRHLLVFASLALASAAFGQINASGSIGFAPSGASTAYDITLRNTGTTTIGTLWYAWIPGQDYLPIAPSAIVSPAGWTFTQTTSAGFGYGLRWVAPAGGAIAPGASLGGFGFTTTTTVGELSGDSIFGTHPPVGTSFVYEGGPFVGGSRQIVINPTPEPGSLGALAMGIVVLRRRRRQ